MMKLNRLLKPLNQLNLEYSISVKAKVRFGISFKMPDMDVNALEQVRINSTMNGIILIMILKYMIIVVII